ncbi:sigma factor G inhibitor Gin [Peribacillus psychrosaccharolyticus]|uniref:Sigma factor G inhibitor Gin n=1 Tax=Peribacillus psychrosaccharolyticus TaxID=1407 RepID=A0A974S2K7_PERPY|nr:sigma factor G inhibitor Gin [Peribacillus psychrosaccharolyticus]QQT02681.1 sigma factor G inhibitor Gin [Peribacillus psychrosaccharolyticus]
MLDTTAAKQLPEELCVVCDRYKEYGIRLYTSYLCIDCEKEIISTETSDPKYKYYLEQLKKVTSS